MGLFGEAASFARYFGLLGAKEAVIAGANVTTNAAAAGGWGVKTLGNVAKSFIRNFADLPMSGRLAIGGISAGIGYGTSEEGATGYQKFERALGFGIGGGLLASNQFRAKAFGSASRGMEHISSWISGSPIGTGYLGAGEIGPITSFKAARQLSHFKHPLLTFGIGGGALYGLMSTQHTVFGGIASGAMLAGAAGINRGGPASWLSARRSVLYGATAGAIMGDMNPGSIAGGSVLGLGLIGGAKVFMKHPNITTALGGGALIVGSNAMAAADIVGKARYDLGAEGDLTLGLHSLRHG